jgi:antitoxin (DNA-binding transcriptional repressor) of toxin-antitoxin stability system
MTTITLKTLEEQVAEIVAQVAAGDTIVITDGGRPIVTMAPARKSRVQELIAEGRAHPPSARLEDLPPPKPGPPLTELLLRMREEERY